jgi:hypothetical protein
MQEKRRKQKEEEDRAREEEGETDTVYETDAAKLNKIMERRRVVQQRRVRRKRGEDLASTTTKESLIMPFTKISKVLASLNNPEAGLDERIRQRNIEHLQKLDTTNIRTSVQHCLPNI